MRKPMWGVTRLHLLCVHRRPAGPILLDTPRFHTASILSDYRLVLICAYIPHPAACICVDRNPRGTVVVTYLRLQGTGVTCATYDKAAFCDMDLFSQPRKWTEQLSPSKSKGKKAVLFFFVRGSKYLHVARAAMSQGPRLEQVLISFFFLLPFLVCTVTCGNSPKELACGCRLVIG